MVLGGGLVGAMLIEIGGGRKVEIREPRRDEFPSNLGGAVEYTITHWIYKILEVMGEGLGTFAAGFLVKFLEILEPEVVDYTAPLLDEILSWPNLPHNIRRFFEELRYPKGQAAAAIAGSLGSAAGGTVVGSVLSTLLAPVTYGLNDIIRPARPTPAEAYAMLWRGQINWATLDDWLSDQGWPTPAINAFKEILRPRASLGDLISWAWRVHKDPNVVRDELRRRGYTDDDISRFIELAHRIPGPGDLVRFALREAWDDRVAAKYGYDADFRPEFQEWMERQGMGGFWPKLYWRSHWVVPSPSMGFEMLHRGIIGMEELDDLLRIADYPPYWRDKLLKISYLTYTRVDVRRMYRVGVFTTFEEVYNAYKEMGYDDDKARHLAEFTIREYGEEEREATKSDILTAYELGTFTRDEAYNALRAIDYPDWIAQVYLDRVDFKRANKIAKEVVRQVKTLYINGLVSKPEVHARLSAVGIPAGEIDEYLAIWDITRANKVARPSITKLKELFIQGIISEAEYRNELANHRYSDQYINWLVEDALKDKADKERKEAEAARKRAEREAKRERRTEYEERKTALDVEIAEARLRITELQLSLAQMIPVEERATIEAEIADIQAEISRERKEMEAIDVDIIAAREELRKLIPHTEREAREEEIASLEVEIRNIEREIAGKKTLLIETQMELEGLEAPEEIATMRDRIMELTEEICSLREQIAAARVRKAEIDVELFGELTAEEIDRLKKEKEELDLAIAEINEEIAAKRTEQATLRRELAASEAAREIKVLTERQLEIRRDMAREREEIAEKKVAIAEARLAMARLIPEERREEIEARIADLRKRKAEIEVEIANKRHRIDLLKADLERLAPVADMERIKREIEELRARIRELELEKARLKFEIQPW